jgi:predicted Zn-dependent protease
MRRPIAAAVLTCLALALSGCAVPAPPPPAGAAPSGAAEQVARNFVSVVARVEPVAERECRARAPGLNCDFQVAVIDRPDMPPNAFQTVDRRGRPIVAFSIALIADARNTDELAFILGHEAAHHIAGHIPRTQASAEFGAAVLGSLARAAGGTPAEIRDAAEVGAAVGARRFSKEFELEADALGTIIARRAGYDPLRGALFFTRIPDPGDEFLGTHPPNSERMRVVREADASLR